MVNIDRVRTIMTIFYHMRQFTIQLRTCTGDGLSTSYREKNYSYPPNTLEVALYLL